MSLMLSVAIAAGIAYYGLRKKSLSPSGAAAALIVGTIHFSCGIHFGATLTLFFLSCSKITKYKSAFKAKVEEDFRENGQRNVWQVLANGLGGCVFALLAARWHAEHGVKTNIALTGFLGHYACCCADTFSSELGIISKKDPILITNLKKVPRGTNGGISALGTAAGAVGGLFMGLTFWLTGRWASHGNGVGISAGFVPLGLLLGLIGTFLDSLVGATCQYTGYSPTLQRVVGSPGPNVRRISGRAIFNNDMVNFVAATLTSFVAVLLAMFQSYR